MLSAEFAGIIERKMTESIARYFTLMFRVVNRTVVKR